MKTKKSWSQRAGHGIRALQLILFASPALIAVPASAGTIARIPSVDEAPSDPAVKQEIDAQRAKGQPVINMWLIISQAPSYSKAVRALVRVTRTEGASPRLMRELAILRTARLIGSPYVAHHHEPMLKACGFTQAQLDGLDHWRGTQNLFDDKSRALLAFVDQYVQTRDVDDSTFETFAKHFSPQEIVEMMVTINHFAGTSTFTKVMRLVIDEQGRQPDFGKC